MQKAILDVAAFHMATDTPIKDKPEWPPPERASLRVALIEEEVDELIAAYCDGDLVGVADALADLIYVAIGMALEFGIPLGAVWNEVQRANMAKIDPATGKARKRDDGKVLKPAGWAPPDIAAVLLGKRR